MRHVCCVIALAIMLSAGEAVAATYYVDNGCASSGDGTTLTCGGTGPVKTISEGITLVVAGDTLNIRGVHGAHGACAGTDGVYAEYVGVWGTSGDAYPGKALTCTVGSPCVVQGCPASACGSDETPTITGLDVKDDWNTTGSGSSTIYYRTMEARTEYVGTDQPLDSAGNDDNYNPVQILYGTDLSDLTQIQFQEPNITSPNDGFWSYNFSTHNVYVNPIGSAGAPTLWVPDLVGLITIQGSDSCPGGSQENCPETAYVTFRRLVLAGSRWMGLLIWPAYTPNYKSGINLDNITVRYIPRFGINPYRNQDFTWENILIEKGSRGVNINPTGYGGGFGLRTANMNGNGIIRNVIIRHYGTAGLHYDNNYATGGTECPWCDPPWNVQAGNYVSTFGLALDIKKGTGVSAQGVTVSDVSGTAIRIDSVHDVILEDFNIQGARCGVGDIETLNDPVFQRVYNATIRNGYIYSAGFNDQGCIWLPDATALGAGEFTFKVYNNILSNCSYAGIAVGPTEVDPADEVYIWNNTVHSSRSALGYTGAAGAANDGIKLLGAITNSEVRNNIISDVAADALEVHDNATTTTFDYELLYRAAGYDCSGNPTPGAVRWGVTGYDGNYAVSTGGTCYSSLGAFQVAYPTQEVHGVAGDPQYVAPSAVPSDLHIQATSAAFNVGVTLSGFSTDYDNQTRPNGAAWDIGADEYLACHGGS